MAFLVNNNAGAKAHAFVCLGHLPEKVAKEFIKKLDKNKNYIFVAHHTTIEGLAGTFASSGEMVIVDRSYKVIGTFKVN